MVPALSLCCSSRVVLQQSTSKCMRMILLPRYHNQRKNTVNRVILLVISNSSPELTRGEFVFAKRSLITRHFFGRRSQMFHRAVYNLAFPLLLKALRWFVYEKARWLYFRHRRPRSVCLFLAYATATFRNGLESPIRSLLSCGITLPR